MGAKTSLGETGGTCKQASDIGSPGQGAPRMSHHLLAASPHAKFTALQATPGCGLTLRRGALG
jgi:hypothetical protein